MAQPDTHKDSSTGAETSASQAAAVKKIRELTGNSITHEEAKRLLVECDGDLPVALNRIADGLESWSEVKEHKPKKEKGTKTGKKKEEGGRGRGRGGRGGRGGHRPEGGAPAANGSPSHPERSGRGGRGRGERGGATQRPAPAGAAPAAQPPKQPAPPPQAAPAHAAPQVARAPIPPPQRHPGLTAAQIVAGAHLQQQAQQHAPTPQQPVQAAPQAVHSATHAHDAAHAHAHVHTHVHTHAHAHPGHSAPAQVAAAHPPAPAVAQTHAAPVSQAPAAAPITQQPAVAAAAPVPAKTEAANGTAAANAPRRHQNGKPKEGSRAPRHDAASAAAAPGAHKSANPVVVLPSSVAQNVGDIHFGSFGMTPLSDNLPKVAQPTRPQQAAVQAATAAHQAHQIHQAHQTHQAQHVTETSAQSVRPEAAYHAHEAHPAEQPVEEAAIAPLHPGGYIYPGPFMPVPFAYADENTGRMHAAYYEPPAAYAAPYSRGTSGSPVGDSASNKLASQQHLLEAGAQPSASASSTAQPNPQHAAYNSQFLAAGFHYYPSHYIPQAGQFYPQGYNPRSYKPAAYMGSYPGGAQAYGAPETEEAYAGGKYAPHGAYNPGAAAAAQSGSSKQSQSQFASPPAAPLDPYSKPQDYASKSYGNRDGGAQYPYQYPGYYPVHMGPPYGGQPQAQSSQPSGRTNQ